MNAMVRLVLAVMVVSVLSARAVAQDVVSQWNDAYLEVLRATTGGPGYMSRTGAMLHGAMFDALNAIDHRHVGYAYNDLAPGATDADAAIATAAHGVLSSIYSGHAGVIMAVDALYDAQMAAIPAGAPKTLGIDLGNAVAGAWIARRVGDGHDQVINYIPGTEPGQWQPVGPNFGGPVTPHWGNVTPFTLDSGSQFRPPLPPALTSQEYADAYNQVKAFGALNSTVRTADQTKIAWFWACDRDGTYHPPGHLNTITCQVVDQVFPGLGYTPEEWRYQELRLLALVNVAMADAGIAAWDSKFNTPIDFWRPTHGIHEGEDDGNPQTAGDPSWQPLSEEERMVGGTLYTGYVPAFPAYVSGHGTFSAAHAAVMREYFGTDQVSFTISSEDPYNIDPNGQFLSRSYSAFSEAALENGLSRVYLGVHWIFDATEAYTLGDEIGEWAHGSAWPEVCYADCDGSGGLDLLDFLCFQEAFVIGNLFADCDGSGAFDIFDFLCYQDAFVVGCE